MLLLGLDLETTGLDVLNDRITEVGAVLWDTDTNNPLICYGTLVRPSKELDQATVDMMQRVCGLTPALLNEYGVMPDTAIENINDIARKAHFVVAHNGTVFDKPLLAAEIKRHQCTVEVLNMDWIDTRIDLPFANPPESMRLKHLACDMGFVNPFAHRALFDVMTMLKVISQFDINEVVALSKQPVKVIRAVVSYDDREKAKALRYSWEKIGDKAYPKCWVKAVKENRVKTEIEQAKEKGFQAVVIE
jgi:DNA polymerase-3 subunit epsilon